jgi:hypothetical protein
MTGIAGGSSSGAYGFDREIFELDVLATWNTMALVSDLFNRLTQCVSVNLKADFDSISTDPNLWNLEVVKASVTAK